MNYPRDFEEITPRDYYKRLKVYGGWIVAFSPGQEVFSMIFISDPDHKWKLTEL